MGDELFLGLDIGISTVKVALFTGQGELVALESDEYMVMPEGEVVEADPEIYWAPMGRSIRKLLKNWGGDPQRIAAVSISSHGETVFPMRADGKPVRKAINWMDNRSQLESDELLQSLGSQKVLEITGQPEVGPIWPVTKYRWMCKHEPEQVKETASFLLPEDYILFRLSGQFAGESTLWSSSLVFDIRQKRLSDELLAFAGISPAQIPAIYPAGTAFGNISAACAAETGLSTKTRVVTGALDQVCAAIGAGNVAPGMITESTGSVLALVASIREPIFDNVTQPALPHSRCAGHVLHAALEPDGRHDPEMVQGHVCARPDPPGAGGRQGRLRPAEHTGRGRQAGQRRADHAAAPGGRFLPRVRHAGAGGVLRLHPQPYPGALHAAIMEAIAYMLRRDLEGLQKLGVGSSELRVLGGGAKSRLWSQDQGGCVQYTGDHAQPPRGGCDGRRHAGSCRCGLLPGYSLGSPGDGSPGHAPRAGSCQPPPLRRHV